MRTIKFRGKSSVDGKIVYGDLIHKVDAVVIRESLWTGSFVEYEVDPDTVEQFTGLYDKNGKEIYEGGLYKC